jgi:hypothetical protein
LNESVISVIPNDQGFEVLTSQNNRYQTKTLIAASGAFAQPYIPQIKGLDKFKGKIIHSASYLNPQNYINQKIVVVEPQTLLYKLQLNWELLKRYNCKPREDKVLPAENPRYGFSLVVKMDRLRKNTLAK